MVFLGFRASCGVDLSFQGGLCVGSRMTILRQASHVSVLVFSRTLFCLGLCLGSDEFVVDFLDSVSSRAGALEYSFLGDPYSVHNEDYAGALSKLDHSWENFVQSVGQGLQIEGFLGTRYLNDLAPVQEEFANEPSGFIFCVVKAKVERVGIHAREHAGVVLSVVC